MDESMKLPDGESCKTCINYGWCKRLFGCKEENTECDYFPVRYRKKDSN